MSHARPIEVAVIGGGCAAVTAAFELTRPEHRGRYRVTIYQLGWRLGGKGASGRGPADRIEEHGFHVWMGFYENAFRLLRECYAELGRDRDRCRIADWQDAFSPSPFVGVVDRSHTGATVNWMAELPPGPGLPGDPLSDANPFTLRSYLTRTVRLLGAMLRSCQARAQPETSAPRAPLGNVDVADAIGQLLKYGVLATATGLLEAVGLLERIVDALPRSAPSLRDPVIHLLDAIGSSARRQLAGLAEHDDEIRRLWEVVDLVLAVLRGAIRFGLATDPRGFDAIDDYDWREWLRLNGASESSLDSAFLRGIYALVFAYEDGDPSRPRLGAGQALRGAFRMFFTYRGAFFWKMRAGMGDVVFAPFYEVLRRRGVAFRFFHRLENVRLVDAARLAPGERAYVEALEFDVQAEVAGGGEYEPLVDVRGLPCWPSRPDYGQLADGEIFAREGRDFESHWDRRRVRSLTLQVGEDFDFVVLGVGLGAVPYVCRELLARDRRWRTMVDNVRTVATQAFQIWLRDEVSRLGCNLPSASVSAFVPPFETWADMAQLLDQESWPARPGAIAYFCGVLPDPPGAEEGSDADYPARRRDEVRENAVRFLRDDVVHFWPGAARQPDGFRWELLLEPPGSEPRAAAGAARFASQFWTANVNPSDRYVLSLPGTARHRISPLDNTYDNMTIAGDWTECGHNAGCVEAAVMSGRLAAHAIAHSPPLAEIVGYDHP